MFFLIALNVLPNALPNAIFILYYLDKILTFKMSFLSLLFLSQSFNNCAYLAGLLLFSFFEFEKCKNSEKYIF